MVFDPMELSLMQDQMLMKGYEPMSFGKESDSFHQLEEWLQLREGEGKVGVKIKMGEAARMDLGCLC